METPSAGVAARTTPTAEDLRNWPLTVSVPQAGRALGIGREASYIAAYTGQLPGAIRIGQRWRVVTATLRAALGVTESVE
jgi:hypothetical protein